MNYKAFSIGLMIFLGVAGVLYIIILYETYKNSNFIFTTYQPPTPPDNSFYPLGSVVAMSQDEIDNKNEIINSNSTFNSKNN